VERLEEYDVRVEQVIACGGIADKSSLAMQIYADIFNRPMRTSRSSQTCALGSAIAAAVVGGAYPDALTAQRYMAHLNETDYQPDLAAVSIYEELFTLYKDLHDAFGIALWQGSLSHIMKNLIDIRDRVRG
jgi:L-ribulokinase